MEDQAASQPESSTVETVTTGETERAAARAVKAYFQLLADLAHVSSESYQVYADHVTPENIFRLDAKNGMFAATVNSFNKAGELVPKTYQRYLKSL